MGVVAETLAKSGTPVPATRTLRAEGQRLALLGWDQDRLREVVHDHDWTNAGAGAVVTWLRELTEPPPAPVPPRPRPAWCGDCDQASRLLVDEQGRPRRGQACPTCSPALAGVP